MLREPPPNEPPELRELPNESRLLPNELPELRELPNDGLLLLLGMLVVERCICWLLRLFPNEDEPFLSLLFSDLGVKVELGLLPNELRELPNEPRELPNELPEGRLTVVRVLLWREPKPELLRLFCGAFELLAKLLLGTFEGRREPKLTRFP